MWGGKSLIFNSTLFHLVRSILTDPFRMIGPKWSKKKFVVEAWVTGGHA